MDIDEKIKEVASEWENAKNQSANLQILLGKMCELNRSIVDLLKDHGTTHSQARDIINNDIDKYQKLFTRSASQLYEIEGEYRKLQEIKRSQAIDISE